MKLTQYERDNFWAVYIQAITNCIEIGRRRPDQRAYRALVANLNQTPPVGYDGRFNGSDDAYAWWMRTNSALSCARADGIVFADDERGPIFDLRRYAGLAADRGHDHMTRLFGPMPKLPY